MRWAGRETSGWRRQVRTENYEYRESLAYSENTDHVEKSSTTSEGKTHATAGSTAGDMNVEDEMSITAEARSPSSDSTEIVENAFNYH